MQINAVLQNIVPDMKINAVLQNIVPDIIFKNI